MGACAPSKESHILPTVVEDPWVHIAGVPKMGLNTLKIDEGTIYLFQFDYGTCITFVPSKK